MHVRRACSLVCAAAALAGLGAASLHHHDQLLAALSDVEPTLFALAAGLHALTLVARSEAWRVSLGAVSGDPLPRRQVHLANAGAFAAGSLQSHATLPVRIALLLRLSRGRSPRPGELLVADAPIIAVEALLAALLVPLAALALPGAPWWIGPLAITGGMGVLLGLRLIEQRSPGRPLVRGLAVLGCVRGRVRLARLVCAIALLTLARILILLAAFGLPTDPSHVALTFVAYGVLGLLPIGAAAGPGATLAAAGSEGLAAAGAAGLALVGSAVAGVLLYAAVVVCAANSVRSGSRSPRRTSRSTSTQSMSRAEASARA